jgi:hypothetical protein
LRYDPEIAPEPDEWLASTEADRLDAVRRHHRRARHHAGNPRLHAAIHVTVENQLAERHPDATEAMNRLVAEGLGRHEAIHALGSVVADEIFDILKSGQPHDPAVYSRRLQALTASARRGDQQE